MKLAGGLVHIITSCSKGISQFTGNRSNKIDLQILHCTKIQGHVFCFLQNHMASFKLLGSCHVLDSQDYMPFIWMSYVSKCLDRKGTLALISLTETSLDFTRTKNLQIFLLSIKFRNNQWWSVLSWALRYRNHKSYALLTFGVSLNFYNKIGLVESLVL